MRKLFLFVFIFVIICFTLPIIFTRKKPVKETIAENKTHEVQEYDYKNYNTIKLLHTANNQVEEIDLDTYLYGVVSSEMPASYEIEALKAQATVARTYTIYKIENENKHENANICDNAACCQAWISKEDRFLKWNEADRETNWDKITKAVDETKGKYVTYEGKAINAFFHSNSGGATETADNVWGGANYPYLQTVATVGEDAYSQYSSQITLTKEEAVNKIKEYHSDIVIDFSLDNAIQILEHTESGRVKTVKFGNLNLPGVEVRTIFGLKSTNFEIFIESENINFNVKGYGHGVGLSQTGADSLAKQGKNYEEIIKHYYYGVNIENI